MCWSNDKITYANYVDVYVNVSIDASAVVVSFLDMDMDDFPNIAFIASHLRVLVFVSAIFVGPAIGVPVMAFLVVSIMHACGRRELPRYHR